MKLVSIYTNAWHSGTDTRDKFTEKPQLPPENLDIDIILDSIKNGLYEKRYPLANVRLAKQNCKLEQNRVEELGLDPKADEKLSKAYENLKKLKDKIPRFTVAGVFKPEARKEVNLQYASELIDIDIDGLEEEELKNLKIKLSQDKYTYSCFVTCGGDGLALLFRIDPKKHLEAWKGISNYLYQNYGITCLDSAHKNPANTRNISSDPDAFILNKYPEVFKEYLPKQKLEKEKNLAVIYSKSDFDCCVREIVDRRIDFCPDYETYRDMGFAIANKLGVLGLDYFDAVCQFGEKYDKQKLVKDYKYLCRNPDGNKKIASFFWRCQTFKIEIYTPETRLIASVASAARKSGKTQEDVVKNLENHEGIKPDISRDIVKQVFEEKIDFVSSAGILDEIQNFLKYNYILKINQITGRFENDGYEWTEADFNSCLISVKKTFDKADAKWTERILFSSYIESYHPIRKFFEDNKDRIPVIKFLEGNPIIPDIIQKLWDSVNTRSAYYTQKFGTKWLVGAVSTWFGFASNLELIFAGRLEKGKTHFIKYILPESIRKYYAELPLDKGTTDEQVAACQKAIINQNECSGKSKQSEENHKAFLDQDVFNLRRPYRRDAEDMKKLAALFGTTEHISDVLTGKKGNRRVIVTEVISRDFKAYDDIDKTDLWMAVYALWKAGFDWQILGEEIKELNRFSADHEEHGLEYELICKYFEPAEEDDIKNERLTSADIKVFIENKTNQSLKIKVIIQELDRMKYEIVTFKQGAISKKVYNIKQKFELTAPSPETPF